MRKIDQAKNAIAFIEDRTHEQHLDQLLWMMRTRRDEAASRVPEWELLRDLASQIKEHTLSNLAHHLEMFESRAKANGVTVHWAQDAHEHNQIVYQLLSDRKSGRAGQIQIHADGGMRHSPLSRGSRHPRHRDGSR
jgi:L-lactate dehydrogenase complex protein LldF